MINEKSPKGKVIKLENQTRKERQAFMDEQVSEQLDQVKKEFDETAEQHQKEADEYLEQGLRIPKRLHKVPTVELPEGYNRIRVQFTLTYKGDSGHTVEGESQTQPDMNMSVQQLLERHSRGTLDPSEVKDGLYEVQVPVFRDFTDITEFTESLRDRLAKAEEWMAEYEKAKKAAEKAAKESVKGPDEQPAKTSKQTTKGKSGEDETPVANPA